MTRSPRCGREHSVTLSALQSAPWISTYPVGSRA